MSHTRILVHVVFATRERRAWLADDDLRRRLFGYLAQTARNVGCEALAAGGWHDHVHLLINLAPQRALSDVVRDVKANASRWFKRTAKLAEFAWQSGFAAFSVSASRSQEVIDYIDRQAEHHARRDFVDEFRRLLEAHGLKAEGAWFDDE